jgi:hypothetical protein
VTTGPLDLFGDVPTVDTGERSDFDFYETPGWMTRSLLHHHPAICGTVVLEPCSGRDAITNVLRAGGCTVITNDIDTRHPAQTFGDATRADFWDGCTTPLDWVITNPPFGVAFAILERAFAYPRLRSGVALLVRKTFLEPTEERGGWFAAHPPTRIIGQPRHSFRGTGSDSVACDWFLWEKSPIRSLPPIVVDHKAKTR